MKNSALYRKQSLGSGSSTTESISRVSTPALLLGNLLLTVLRQQHSVEPGPPNGSSFAEEDALQKARATVCSFLDKPAASKIGTHKSLKFESNHIYQIKEVCQLCQVLAPVTALSWLVDRRASSRPSGLRANEMLTRVRMFAAAEIE